MTGVLAIAVVVGILAVVLLVVVSALVELFQQVQQIRGYLDMVDRVTPLDLGRSKGVSASAVGLPAALDTADRALVLFLSDKCGSCRTIAATLAGGALPPTLTLLIEPMGDSTASIADEFELVGERVLVDHGERIATLLGLDIFPAAVLIERGRLEAAQTVPTPRQLYAALPIVQARVPARRQSTNDQMTPITKED